MYLQLKCPSGYPVICEKWVSQGMEMIDVFTLYCLIFYKYFDNMYMLFELAIKFSYDHNHWAVILCDSQ